MTEAMNHPEPAVPQPIRDVLTGRRTINFFKPDRIPDSVLFEAIDSARWAPNHGLTEPWHFHILGPETIDNTRNLITRLKAAGKAASVREGVMKRLKAIPGWLVVSCKNSADPLIRMEDYAACCCAVQNMMLYLWAVGIGVKWTTGEVTRDERFYRLLGLDPDNSTIVGLFWYGYPAVITPQRRKPGGEITTFLA